MAKNSYDESVNLPYGRKKHFQVKMSKGFQDYAVSQEVYTTENIGGSARGLVSVDRQNMKFFKTEKGANDYYQKKVKETKKMRKEFKPTKVDSMDNFDKSEKFIDEGKNYRL